MLRHSTTAALRQCLSSLSSHHPLSQRFQNPRCSFSKINKNKGKNWKTRGRRQSKSDRDAGDSARTATRSQAPASAADNNDATTPTSRTGNRTIRSLRPILVTPSFPSDRISIPFISTPETSSSSDQNTDPPSSVRTVITITGLPPNVTKADIRPIFQRYGEVARIHLHPDGKDANVIFVDDHGVKRTLHAYAERPIRVRGREITVFRSSMTMNDEMVDTASPSQATPTGGGGGGVIFVSDFPPKMTQEDLIEALEPFGEYKKFVMLSGFKSAYFIYSDKDRVGEILRVHKRVPITVLGQNLRVELAEKHSQSLSVGILADALERGKPLDSATSSAIVEELTQTVSRFRGLQNPSRVLWIGGLPRTISETHLANFWSRLGCVVDVRTTSFGFAHVEFASIDDAVRAVRQCAPRGFRHNRLPLDMDFADWEFYVRPANRVVYISRWPASDGRPTLLRWASDVRNIAGATVLPPFRGKNQPDTRGAFLQFWTTGDARAALQMLDGRAGPGGVTLHLGLSRSPVVHPDQMLRWIDMEKNAGGKGGEARLEDEWGGLGFASGMSEEQREYVESLQSLNTLLYGPRPTPTT